jgi:hypothetical protein
LHEKEPVMIMDWKLAGYVKWAAKLLLTEMFVPGGTLVVLALLLASHSSHPIVRRLVALVPFRKNTGRPQPVGT